jgi:hypothetical protein
MAANHTPRQRLHYGRGGQAQQFEFLIARAAASLSFCSGRRLGRIGYAPPGIVRVKRRHAASDAGGVRAQILFVDAPLVIDEKRYYARVPVLRRISHQREPAEPGLN